MKTLFIIRHAKSSWDDNAQTDFDRGLNKRGKRDAPYMADIVKHNKEYPDLIISSPANRAMITAKIFADTLGIDHNLIQQDERIYEASLDALLQVINGVDDSLNNVFLFGHNPGMYSLLAYYTGVNSHVPTCAIAKIRFPVNRWQLLFRDLGRLEYMDFPKNHF